MQYLEGETLETRLRRGALPITEALTIASQIADALDKAHHAGVVHRDLKPGNIMLTKAGSKLLDFGLAKSAAPLAGDSGLSMLPTAAPLTAQGTILGTFQYMSPEQVRGERAETASDIFSLGCVISEMLTGRRAFERASSVETLAAILKDEPRAIEDVPPEVARLVRRCLAKHPHERFQSARDLAFDLRNLATAGDADDAPADSLAVLPFTNAGGTDAEYLSDGIAESLIDSFSQIARLRVVPRSVAFRYKGQEVDPRVVGARARRPDAALGQSRRARRPPERAGGSGRRGRQ